MGTQYSIKTNDSDGIVTATVAQINELVAGGETTLHSHAGGSGDMQKSTYDPQSVAGDAFDADNHTDGTTNKVYTATEKTKLSGIASGADVTGSNTCDTPGGAGTDTTAIHDNTANEISAIAEKESPASADVLIIEDSAASYAKKKVQITNLPAGTPGADSINDTHIDWGAGANQVDADDVPESATRKWAGESGATQDQTGAEIKSAYEAEADTNAYTDAEKTKLTGIATAATKYPDTGEQAFLDADHSKLDGIEASAVALATVKADADVSDAISKKHTQNADTDLDATFEATLKDTDNHTSGSTNKVYTATEQTKLSGIEALAVALTTVKADADISDAISNKHAEAHTLASHSSMAATGLVIENRTDDPGSPVTGQIWLRTDL